MPNYNLKRQIEICSAAELPEKLGVDENAIYVHEGSRFMNAEDALHACPTIEAEHGNPGLIILEALVPKLPIAVSREIEDYRAKLPKLMEKYSTLQEIDPATGAESWKQNMQAEIIARTRAGKSKSEKGKEKLKTCDGCSSKINIAHIEGYLCPVCKTFPFMETNTDAKAMANRELRLSELRKEIEQADQTIEEMETRGRKEATEFKRAWLVYEKHQEQPIVPNGECQVSTPVETEEPQVLPEAHNSEPQSLIPSSDTALADSAPHAQPTFSNAHAENLSTDEVPAVNAF